eukprot:8440765-Pyramimonas_sp.AAC.1
MRTDLIEPDTHSPHSDDAMEPCQPRHPPPPPRPASGAAAGSSASGAQDYRMGSAALPRSGRTATTATDQRHLPAPRGRARRRTTLR